MKFSRRRLLEKGSDTTRSSAIQLEDDELDSPHPEVRAAVPNFDDPDTPQNTLRMWVLGFITITVVGGVNVILTLKRPAFALGAHVCAVAIWPLGKLWEVLMPRKKIFGVQLNPGKFNLKEHALIFIMSSAALSEGPTYGLHILVTESHFMGRFISAGYVILLIFFTQLMGLALGGLCKKILVYPDTLIWPSCLVDVTLLANMHIKSNYTANGWKISRLRLLMVLIGAGTLYQWFPGFIFPALSSFNWAAWLAPENVVVSQIFGINQGLSLLPITFDWSQVIGYLGSPMVPPLGALINILACLVIFFWLVSPIISFTNVWYGDYLPLVSSYIFDRYQNQYDTSAVLSDGKFDDAKYRAYSPLFMSETTVIAYGLALAAIPASIAHSALFDWPYIKQFWKKSNYHVNDVHMRLMRNYREVSGWWYFELSVVCLVLMIVFTKVYTELNIGAMFLALFMSALFIVPSGLLFATTNFQISLNVIAEFIIGYIQPGKAEAMMIFKTIAFYTNATAIVYVSHMKTGHYLKLRPRVVFAVQVFGALWAGYLQWPVVMWARGKFEGLCTATQPQGYTCPLAQVFYSSAITWGTIGPKRIFKIYQSILWFFLIGGVLPLISWIYVRRYPRSCLRHINWPVLFNSAALLPPATPYNYGVYLGMGFLFAYYIRVHYFNWWAKYNYTVSAGLELGVAFGQLAIVIVTTVILNNASFPNWWGTVGAFDNVDSLGEPRIVLPTGSSFGPSSW